MKPKMRDTLARGVLAAASLLGGGTVLGTCEIRLHDALVTGTKSAVFGVFGTMLEDLTDSLGAVETTDTTTP